ncbi:MAG: phosphoribosylamine--glycine ligase [Myxococcales bacterium]|nr:MAG: phosphoribosylamine--glycine ligase [Myxococcales bacterium]
MKVLVVGSGGREHAFVWKLAQSPQVQALYAAPGSDAIGELARCAPVKANDVKGLVDFARKEKIDLTIIGPEEPLTLGIGDAFADAGLALVGPSAKAAQIEGSKAFAKYVMKKYGIPTADFEIAATPQAASAAVLKMGLPLVIKADGLAAGKGVILCYNEAEAEDAIRLIMVDKQFGASGAQVVIEKLLVGEEASFIALTDGETVLPMASSQDHKRVFNDDQGPNTGGMGAYSPAPVVTDELHRRVMDEVMLPMIRALAAEGCPYRGVLYAGLMINGGQPSVLEFNARFGDPETQPILARLKSDLAALLLATTNGTLGRMSVEWDPRPAVCVVMASGGYPAAPQTGFPISGLDEVKSDPDVVVFHAGTKRIDGQWTNSGGRVLGVTALGETIESAVRNCYGRVETIQWQGAHYRTDIARRAFGRMT